MEREKIDSFTPRSDSRRARPPPEGSVFKVGRNCWRKESATRLAFVIDAAAFFETFVAAASRATHQILIVGWDIDSRVVLNPGSDGQMPLALKDFLARICEERPDLRIYILSWDFTFIYSFEREALPQIKFEWLGHPRVRFFLDGSHPRLGSHHQKIIVVDDRVAFSGGLDLTARRWDTPEHAANDQRRTDPWGKSYGPFHDVQAIVEGEAARALGDLARERWRVATGETLPPPPPLFDVDRWPTSLAADVTDVEVAIARTVPLMRRIRPVYEVERLFIDSIARARRFLFFEAQYFSSKTIANCLARRLRERDGPEIAMILPRDATGWIEESTMSVLRGRVLDVLREADRYGRFKVYHPIVPNLEKGYVKVHSKVMIADDEFCRIGSANLNQRSMGLDTECDLAFETRGEGKTRGAIAGLRARLLGEHLAVSPEEVEEKFSETGSLIATIEALRGGPRTLVELERRIPEWLDILVPSREVIDPSGPYRWRRGLRRYFPNVAALVSRRVPWLGRSKLIPLIVLITLLLIAWRFTPLREWVEPDAISSRLSMIKSHPLGPLGVIAAYVLGGLVLVPQTALVVATALTFDTHGAFWLSMGGTMASAAVTYWLGGRFTADRVARLSNRWLRAVQEKLAAGGWLAVAVVRMVPMAPFSVVNLVAGSLRIPFGDFLIGTVIGTLPGVVAITFLAERIERVLRVPDLKSVFLLAVLILTVFAALRAARYFLGRRAS